MSAYQRGENDGWPTVLFNGEPLPNDDFVAELNRQHRMIENLSMLVARLTVERNVVGQAKQFLRDNNLEGSPLRQDDK